MTTSEAARRLGVAPATVKRWADLGLMRVERTVGGHRRIPLSELRRLIATSRTAPISEPLVGWIETLLSGDPQRIRSALVASRMRASNWAMTADEVASAMTELGRLWEEGSCAVVDEHLASEALRRAAGRCVDELWRDENGPRAALLTVAGERHTLGLSLAELVLAEQGWRTLWIGEGPPASELCHLVEKYSPRVLVVSASQACGQAAIISYQRELGKAASRAGVGLVLAGSGMWRSDTRVQRIGTFNDLHTLLANYDRRNR